MSTNLYYNTAGEYSCIDEGPSICFEVDFQCNTYWGVYARNCLKTQNLWWIRWKVVRMSVFALNGLEAVKTKFTSDINSLVQNHDKYFAVISCTFEHIFWTHFWTVKLWKEKFYRWENIFSWKFSITSNALTAKNESALCGEREFFSVFTAVLTIFSTRLEQKNFLEVFYR